MPNSNDFRITEIFDPESLDFLPCSPLGGLIKRAIENIKKGGDGLASTTTENSLTEEESLVEQDNCIQPTGKARRER